MPLGSPTAVYVFDASSLIQLERRKLLKILTELGDRVEIPERVKREVNTARSDLEGWLRKNPGRVARFLTVEHSLYYQFIIQRDPSIGDGEAAAMATALNRGHVLVIDDATPRSKAQSHGVTCLSADQFLSQPLL
jgi:predicted nucleic acid-binding protein